MILPLSSEAQRFDAKRTDSLEFVCVTELILAEREKKMEGKKVGNEALPLCKSGMINSTDTLQVTIDHHYHYP